jgi:hypothetical protein
MQVVGDFNKISEKLKSEIPTLKPNEVATFEVLYGVPNPDPDQNEKMRNPKLYGKRQISTHQRIYDKYILDKAGNEVGGYVNVGVVEGWDGDKPARFKCFVPGFGQHQFMGKFSLMAGRIEDMELYEFLMISNEREGNPHRDTSVKPLFRLINSNQQSTAITNKVDILRDALNKVGKITEDKAKEVWASLNKPTESDFGVLKALVSSYASENPDQFLLAFNDENGATKLEIKQALDLGVLNYDLSSGKLTQGKNDLTTIQNSTDLLEDIMGWFTINENGKSVLELVRKGIKQKNKKEVA